MHYVRGRKDGIKREVCFIPEDMENPKKRADNLHAWCLLRNDHGKMVEQIISIDRIHTDPLDNRHTLGRYIPKEA